MGLSYRISVFSR